MRHGTWEGNAREHRMTQRCASGTTLRVRQTDHYEIPPSDAKMCRSDSEVRSGR